MDGPYCDCVILAMDGPYSLIVIVLLIWPWTGLIQLLWLCQLFWQWIRPYHRFMWESRRFVFGITA